jgi:hypothetical protein
VNDADRLDVERPLGPSSVPPITLNDEHAFRSHPWLQTLEVRYGRDALLAKHATHRLTSDLNDLGKSKSARPSFYGSS